MIISSFGSRANPCSFKFTKANLNTFSVAGLRPVHFIILAGRNPTNHL